MMRWAVTAALLLMFATPVWAGFDEGKAAYDRGDYATALRELRPLAEQGNARAQTGLGHMYRKGLGVPKDYAEAVRWYLRAAEQENAKAQNSLALMYEKGQGVPQDYVQAHQCYNLAASRGRKQAAKHREAISRKMTPAQIAEAQRLVSAWKPRKIETTPSVPYEAMRNFPSRAPNRDGIAVIIGNKTYQGRVPAVDYAHNDADAVKRYVVERLGYRPGNVINLRDASKAQLEATFGNKEIHKGKLFNYVRPGISDVTVFYSGHGVPGLNDRRGYLLPVNGNPNLVEITGYPVDVLYANLAKIPAKSVTVFLDACFSGDSPKGMLIRATSGISVTAKPQRAEWKAAKIRAISRYFSRNFRMEVLHQSPASGSTMHVNMKIRTFTAREIRG